jgi:hypothetical protein
LRPHHKVISLAPLDGVAASTGYDEDSLKFALTSLVDADLLFADGVPPEASYRFKHALIRDAAYDSLLKSRRQTLHRRAAAALIATQSEPKAIAHHFTAAGADDLAIERWGNAGDEALRRSALIRVPLAAAPAQPRGRRTSPAPTPVQDGAACSATVAMNSIRSTSAASRRNARETPRRGVTCRCPGRQR